MKRLFERHGRDPANIPAAFRHFALGGLCPPTEPPVPSWLAEARALAPPQSTAPPWEEGTFPDPLPAWCGTVEVVSVQTRARDARPAPGPPPRRPIPEEREPIPPPSGRTVQARFFD